MKKWHFWSLLASAILVVPQLAGYTFLGSKWQNAQAHFHLKLGSSSGVLIDGSPSWNAALANALATWNSAVPGVTLTWTDSSTQPNSDGDGVNCIFFSNTIYGKSFGSNTLAVTTHWRIGPKRTEADLIFNSVWPWNSYRGNLRKALNGKTMHDIRRVALHELGHALGLDHPDESGQRVTAVMNSTISNIDGLQADDVNGARALYPTPTPTPTPLPPQNIQSGQTLSGSVEMGKWRYYYIDVPADASQMQVRLTGSNDADLYISKGSQPYVLNAGFGPLVAPIIAADSRSTNPGSAETILIFRGGSPALQGGGYYIGVYGYGSGTSNYQLSISVTLGGSSGQTANSEIRSGQSRTDTVAKGEWRYYFFDVPATAEEVQIYQRVVNNAFQSATVYVKAGSKPTQADNDGETGSSTIQLNREGGLKTGRYFIGVTNSVWASSQPYEINLVIKEKITSTSDIPIRSGQTLVGDVKPRAWLYYYFDVPAGSTQATVQLWQGGGYQCDMFIRYGQRPTLTAYDHKRKDSSGVVNITGTSAPPLRAGRYFVGAYGSFVGGSYELILTQAPNPETPPPNLPVLSSGQVVRGLVNRYESVSYRVYVPSDTRKLQIHLNGSGNADLFWHDSASVLPSPGNFSKASTGSGTNEKIEITWPPGTSLNRYFYFTIFGNIDKSSYLLGASLSIAGSNEPAAPFLSIFSPTDSPIATATKSISIDGGSWFGTASAFLETSLNGGAWKRTALPVSRDVKSVISGLTLPLNIIKLRTVDQKNLFSPEQTIQVASSTAVQPVATPGSTVIAPESPGGGTVPLNALHIYALSVPAGTTKLKVFMNGTGNADLYLRRGQAPTALSFDARSTGATSLESLELSATTTPALQAGVYYLAVHGVLTTSTYGLFVQFENTIGTPPPVALGVLEPAFSSISHDRSSLLVKGIAFSASGIKTIEGRVNSGPWKTIVPGANSIWTWTASGLLGFFETPVRGDGNLLEIRAIDRSGLTSEIKTITVTR